MPRLLRPPGWSIGSSRRANCWRALWRSRGGSPPMAHWLSAQRAGRRAPVLNKGSRAAWHWRKCCWKRSCDRKMRSRGRGRSPSGAGRRTRGADGWGGDRGALSARRPLPLHGLRQLAAHALDQFYIAWDAVDQAAGEAGPYVPAANVASPRGRRGGGCPRQGDRRFLGRAEAHARVLAVASSRKRECHAAAVGHAAGGRHRDGTLTEAMSNRISPSMASSSRWPAPS